MEISNRSCELEPSADEIALEPNHELIANLSSDKSGSILPDDATLSQCNIEQLSTLHFNPVIVGGYQIIKLRIVNHWTMNFSVEVAPHDNILQVKREIYNESRIPPENQKLTLNGLELDEQKTLSDYGIVGECTLNMALCNQIALQVVVYNSRRRLRRNELPFLKTEADVTCGRTSCGRKPVLAHIYSLVAKPQAGIISLQFASLEASPYVPGKETRTRTCRPHVETADARAESRPGGRWRVSHWEREPEPPLSRSPPSTRSPLAAAPARYRRGQFSCTCVPETSERSWESGRCAC
ncbi:unnamed protein product [Nesidiocoris tenuis]|uniref:Ubiquitin-like domain-containing protein n=1 Tax=Nesidiocoris tenuis TaxID=355587 RepID=A0A6H5HD42_9HEMI|nr:unnamed protein product [Nesidiocoris tenuis]